MTKRLISLMLVLVMLLSLCMTACSSESEDGDEEEEQVQRENVALTIYAITNESTTKEALDAVEEKISNYCVAKYKTSIDLRFFTESEYQAGLDAMYDQFAAQEAAAKKAEEEKKAAEKSEAAYKATLTAEERKEYDQQKRLEAKKQKEEAEKLAQKQQELIAQGKDVATVKDVQMDIIYINGMEDYYSYIDSGLLNNLTTYLSVEFKNLKDYIYPSFLTAATVSSGIYGIPNNQAISTNETYFVVNKALAEKYQVDWTKVRSITDLNSVFAQIRANEAGVTPIYGDFDPEGIVFYPEADMGNTVGIFTDTLVGGTFSGTTVSPVFNPENENSAFVNYCATKAQYRAAGYMSDTNENFFLSVQELTEEQKKEWEAKGYTAILYKGAKFTTEAALNSGLFGISKYCEKPDRAMEIIQLLSSDSELRNLLAFGIEDVHYIKNNNNPNTITVVDNSYSMDFFKTGNTLIGYVPTTMDADYVQKAKEKNLNSFLDPFLGFTYDWSASNQKDWLTLHKQWKDAFGERYQTLVYGTQNYLAILGEMYNEMTLNENKAFVYNYEAWQKSCTFRSSYEAHVTSTLSKLNETIHFEESDQAAS